MQSLVLRSSRLQYQLLTSSCVSGIQQVVHKRRIYYNPSYFHQVGKQPLVYRNLGEQLSRAGAKYGQRPALISCPENKVISFEDAKSEAGNLAYYLRSFGLQHGDHVGIWAPNTSQWYISFLAAALAGFPLVCLNPALQATELEYALRKAKVKAIITMDKSGKQNFVQVLQDVLPEMRSDSPFVVSEKLPDLKHLIVKSNKTWQTAHNYDALWRQRAASHDIAYLYVQAPRISAESPCHIQFTSGTTGQPKAAVLTHFNFVNAAHQFGINLQLHEQHRRICCAVPFFHAFGLAAIVAALDFGATLVVPSEFFNATATLDAIEQEQCNVVLGSPSMYVDMLEKQRENKRSTNSLEIGIVGDSVCAPEVYRKTRESLGLKTLKIGYGLSEATAAVFIQDGSEDLDRAVHTVGRLYEHIEAKVINERGETVNFGEPGELCVRGAFIMRGYFEDEHSTHETLDMDGWLKTGDQFILEETGVGRIIGRKKDMIIRDGENIFPKEIEDFLLTHNDILEAQVVGVPDTRMGEELCAFIRLKEGTSALSIQAVQKFCEGRLAHYKIPRFLRIVSEFPKTTTGKIQKFKLKELFQNSS